jgi:hypothetical protein
MADVNTAWLNNLKEQINAIPDCNSLNKLIAWMKEMFQELIDNIVNQIAKLVGLIIPPTSLSKIIKYLKNLATQYLGPYLAAIRQLAQMIKAFAEVLAAIQNKLANLHCSISSKTIISQLKTQLTTAAYQKLYAGNSTLAQLTDIAQKLKAGVPTLDIIAQSFGVSKASLPAIADQYGGTLPFMSAMLDKYQPAEVPTVPSVTVPETPTEITLDNPAPTIESVYKTSGGGAGGPAAGNSGVTINGSGFIDGATVTIGSECIGVQWLSATVLICVTEATPAGVYDVVVTNPDGQSATKLKAWTYS